MSRVTSLLIVSVLATFVCGEEPSKPSPSAKPEASAADAKAFLQDAVKAMTAAKTVSYDVDYVVTGWFTYFLPNIKGTVVMGKETEHKVQRFSSKLVVEPSGSEAKMTVTAGADGDIYYVFDDANKIVHADIDPAVVGKNRWGIEFALVKEFGVAEPFADILKSGEIKIEGTTQVDGVDCMSLRLKSANDPEALWEFAVSDKLPRRISFAQTNEKGDEGKAVMTLRKLTVNPNLSKDPFPLVVPEGYKKTDEFAP